MVKTEAATAVAGAPPGTFIQHASSYTKHHGHRCSTLLSSLLLLALPVWWCRSCSCCCCQKLKQNTSWHVDPAGSRAMHGRGGNGQRKVKERHWEKAVGGQTKAAKSQWKAKACGPRSKRRHAGRSDRASKSHCLRHRKAVKPQGKCRGDGWSRTTW